MVTTLQWMTCDGGPHILLPAGLREVWRGADGPTDGRLVEAKFRWSGEPDDPATDFDAACDVEALVDKIEVDGCDVLVLGDEVPMSTWMPSAHFEGGVLVIPMTWVHGTTDSDLVGLVKTVARSAYQDTGTCYAVTSPVAYLMPAVDRLEEGDKAACDCCLPIALAQGQYRVLSTEVRLGGLVLRLHGLQRVVPD